MRRILLVAGELLVTLGVLLALFVGYQLYWTGQQTAQTQRALLADWNADGAAQHTEDGPGLATAPAYHAKPGPPPVPRLGKGIAVLHIPRLGYSWRWVVVEGIRRDDLRNGPGHYPKTAGPGEVGNFAIAGHRATYGEPFRDLDQLRFGDQIVAETRDAWWVYRVRENKVVAPDRWDVVAPVPEHAGERARKHYLTLTTCHPRWGSTSRMVVTATLDKRIAHDQGPPPGVTSW